jgi:alkanesulfonate monooxygenase SsuD/methylene tetrahydromethanopterin reductase-like flavin-dependent oxidoreductase (luciferase family)
MEFGIFHEFTRRAGQSEAEAFGEAFALVDAAEEWGIDVMWLAELHQSSVSLLSSPVTVAAAIAARTSRMRIGPAVQVMPLAQPLRVAEEWATVDHISRGRVIFGIGRASSPRAYVAYGVPYNESRDRLAESVEVIRRAWTEPTFSYEGKFYHYANASATPKPYQQPHPPIRAAATSAETFPALGAQGYPILTATRQGGLAELGSDLAAYRAAYRDAGHPGPGGVYLRIPIYVAETMEQAIAEPEESIMQFYRATAAELTRAPGVRDNLAPDVRAERAQALATVTYEQALRDKLIVGTPDVVAARLQAIRDEIGIDGILAELNCGRQIPREKVMRSLSLLCHDVMPRFR